MGKLYLGRQEVVIPEVHQIHTTSSIGDEVKLYSPYTP